MTIVQFLTFLASAGGASAALSFIAERIPAFQKLTSPNKALIHLCGSLSIALTAYAVLTYVPAETLSQLAPYFQIAYGVVGTWIANQVAHTHDPAFQAMPK